MLQGLTSLPCVQSVSLLSLTVSSPRQERAALICEGVPLGSLPRFYHRVGEVRRNVVVLDRDSALSGEWLEFVLTVASEGYFSCQVGQGQPSNEVLLVGKC